MKADSEQHPVQNNNCRQMNMCLRKYTQIPAKHTHKNTQTIASFASNGKRKLHTKKNEAPKSERSIGYRRNFTIVKETTQQEQQFIGNDNFLLTLPLYKHKYVHHKNKYKTKNK